MNETTQVPAKTSSTAGRIYATWEPGPEERLQLIRLAAYYIAEREGFKGNESEHWTVAEHQVNQMLALRESQERLQIIIDTALDAVVQMDSGGVITGWSNLAESIFGWPREEAVGRTLHETIMPPRYHEAHVRGIKQFLATGEGRILNSRIEVFARHRDGHEFPVELSVAPIKLAGKYEFSAFVRDITERKRQENLINETNALLMRQKADLEAILGRVRRLEGLLSICMNCKKIRTESNDWLQFERYISEHSDAVFSHGLCPECLNNEMKKLD